MKKLFALTIASVILLAGCSSKETAPLKKTDAPTKRLMRWQDLKDRRMPKPTESINIGDASTDIVDLWMPDGTGPHPVVIMIHGGCWQKAIADRTLMNYAAEDLRKRGIAVWNIEYRGVDQSGGGYPGTFHDVAKASDAIKEHAENHKLDLSNIVVFGHSAGGHLGLWLAGRPQLPASSPLYSKSTLPIAAVVNSGGLADLKASAPVTLPGCLASIMDDLTGPPSENRPNVFSDTSPVELLPMNVNQISVNAKRDPIAPQVLGKGYTEKAKLAGDKANFVSVAGGHVELISPGTEAFEEQAKIILALFDR